MCHPVSSDGVKTSLPGSSLKACTEVGDGLATCLLKTRTLSRDDFFPLEGNLVLAAMMREQLRQDCYLSDFLLRLITKFCDFLLDCVTENGTHCAKPMCFVFSVGKLGVDLTI